LIEWRIGIAARLEDSIVTCRGGFGKVCLHSRPGDRRVFDSLSLSFFVLQHYFIFT